MYINYNRHRTKYDGSASMRGVLGFVIRPGLGCVDDEVESLEVTLCTFVRNSTWRSGTECVGRIVNDCEGALPLLGPNQEGSSN